MTKLYNLEYLEEISAGDKTFISEMLSDFVSITPSTLAEIENQVNSKSWDDLYKTVHRFIPTFEFVGAENISNDLKVLENFAKTKTNTEQIPLLFQNIKGFCSDILKELKTDFNIV